MKISNKLILTTALGAGSAVLAYLTRQQPQTIELADRTILITGGSRGLGLELARQAVSAGAKVAICARNKAELQRARRELNRLRKEEGNSTKVLAISCDVTQPGQVKSMIRRVKRTLGPVEILINNAGIIQVGPEEEMNRKEFEEAINTHYWGPWHTMQAVLPGMREQQAGRIVNIASIGGKVSIPHLLPYSASKHALVGLSEGYRMELLKEGIYVTTVCPGLLRTGSAKNAIFKGQHRKEQTWFTVNNASPLVSIGAEEAAEKILEAAKRGSGTVVLSVPAQILSGINGVFPGLVSNVLGLVDRWLPDAGGIGEQRRRGENSESDLSPSWLTYLNEKAAERNNE